MNDISILADRAIERAKNLQEFRVFRDIKQVMFRHGTIPYRMNHAGGGSVEITVPAISQSEAESRVDAWLRAQKS